MHARASSAARMNPKRLIGRVRGLLVAPRREWQVIAAENTSLGALYREHVLWLAALPAICGFVRGSIIGYASAAFLTARIGLADGISRMIFGYLISLAIVYVLGLIVDALAPKFGARRNAMQSFKIVAYSLTPLWVASLSELLPLISPLVLTAGAGYSIWHLFTGLRYALKVPRRRALTYTAIVVLSAVLISISFLIFRAGLVAMTLRLI